MISSRKETRRPIACRLPDRTDKSVGKSLFPLLLSHVRERFLTSHHGFASPVRNVPLWFSLKLRVRLSSRYPAQSRPLVLAMAAPEGRRRLAISHNGVCA